MRIDSPEITPEPARHDAVRSGGDLQLTPMGTTYTYRQPLGSREMPEEGLSHEGLIDKAAEAVKASESARESDAHEFAPALEEARRNQESSQMREQWDGAAPEVTGRFSGGPSGHSNESGRDDNSNEPSPSAPGNIQALGETERQQRDANERQEAERPATIENSSIEKADRQAAREERDETRAMSDSQEEREQGSKGEITDRKMETTDRRAEVTDRQVEITDRQAEKSDREIALERFLARRAHDREGRERDDGGRE
jgi:hypothetical protein